MNNNIEFYVSNEETINYLSKSSSWFNYMKNKLNYNFPYIFSIFRDENSKNINKEYFLYIGDYGGVSYFFPTFILHDLSNKEIEIDLDFAINPDDFNFYFLAKPTHKDTLIFNSDPSAFIHRQDNELILMKKTGLSIINNLRTVKRGFVIKDASC